jgi:fatty acid amide hydrolase 2
MHESLRWSACEIVRRIAARDVSPVEVVDAHIDRIAAVNGAINAVVAERFEDARREAEEAAARVRAGVRMPLLGVPCTIKEFVAVAGMPQTGGILFRRGVRAEHDSPVVARLKAAGAIVLGVTNAPEGGLWPETNNPVYGRTNNPHDTARTSGGSSGGEGAIVAAGGAPFGIGSDTGGSIRIPAGFCGVAGHKPTGGIVPNTDHFPGAPDIDLPVMVTGPLARRVEDLARVLPIIAGPDGRDPWIRGPVALGDPADVDLRGVTVYPAELGRPEIREGVRRATDALVAAGAKRGELARPYDLRGAFELWASVMHETGIRYDDVVAERKVPLGREFARYLVGRNRHAGGVLAILALQRYAPVGRRSGGLAAARAACAELEARLGPRGVMVVPVYTRTAPRHRGMAVGNPFDTGCTTLFNITGFPVTVVRCGEDAHGLPISVQLAGIRGADPVTLAAGAAVEAAFGGWRGPVDPHAGRTLAQSLRGWVRTPGRA